MALSPRHPSRSEGIFDYVYDANGNMVNDGHNRYDYDRLNRLVKVKLPGGREIGYQYNGDGLLAARIMNGETTRYHYDRGMRYLETSGGADVARTAFTQGPLVRQVSGQGKAYFVTDGHGDVRALYDAAGQSVGSYSYGAFGEKQEASGSFDNPFRYTGEPWEEEVGLLYLRARFYAPGVGRFVTEDTYQGQLEVPWTQHRFVYVGNNPLNLWDPSGNVPLDRYKYESAAACELGDPRYCEKLPKQMSWTPQPVPIYVHDPRAIGDPRWAPNAAHGSELDSVIQSQSVVGIAPRPIAKRPLANGTEIWLYPGKQWRIVEPRTAMEMHFSQVQSANVTLLDEAIVRLGFAFTVGKLSGKIPGCKGECQTSAGAGSAMVQSRIPVLVPPRAGTVRVVIFQEIAPGEYDNMAFEISHDGQSFSRVVDWWPYNYGR
jgi:RHS repeat-associated protein